MIRFRILITFTAILLFSISAVGVAQDKSAEIVRRSAGRAIDMDLLLRMGGAQGSIVLQKGDQIYIPPMPSGIQVTGAVAFPGPIHMVPSRIIKEKSFGQPLLTSVSFFQAMRPQFSLLTGYR
jgi:hypothetical protein